MAIRMTLSPIGVMGGSGFYKLLQDPSSISIETPWGSSKLLVGNIGERRVIFIPRHGESHAVPPHQLNHRSHIFALFQQGVKEVFATNAVGSLSERINPGDVVIIDQFLDFISPPTTFFDGQFSVKVGEEMLEGVRHTDMTSPYSERLGKAWRAGCVKVGLTVHMGGTYAMMHGPRFETPAEIRALRSMGATVVGMTSVPEAVLCRELGIEYSTACVVTNHAAGMQKAISHEEVLEIFGATINAIRKALAHAISTLEGKEDDSTGED